MFKFFVSLKKYSYIDRIGNALTVQPIEMALKDALRDLSTLYGSSSVDEKGLHYIQIKIDDRVEKKYLPKIPSQEDVRDFLEKVRKNISYARKLAIYSLTY